MDCSDLETESPGLKLSYNTRNPSHLECQQVNLVLNICNEYNIVTQELEQLPGDLNQRTAAFVRQRVKETISI
jgi:hypothetical protein